MNFSTKLQEGNSVYECNDMCRCGKTCRNRILQKGVQVKLEVFKTKEKVGTVVLLINSKLLKRLVMLTIIFSILRDGE